MSPARGRLLRVDVRDEVSPRLTRARPQGAWARRSSCSTGTAWGRRRGLDGRLRAPGRGGASEAACACTTTGGGCWPSRAARPATAAKARTAPSTCCACAASRRGPRTPGAPRPWSARSSGRALLPAPGGRGGSRCPRQPPRRGRPRVRHGAGGGARPWPRRAGAPARAGRTATGRGALGERSSWARAPVRRTMGTREGHAGGEGGGDGTG